MAEVLTEQQRAVVTDRGGKLLVSAAAGSGKTKVLVDRLLMYITESGGQINIDDFLIITYTKAAAAELRGKIAVKLNERLAEDPGNKHLQRQLQRLYLTKISTVHAFCSDILREYAYHILLLRLTRITNHQRHLVRSILTRSRWPNLPTRHAAKARLGVVHLRQGVDLTLGILLPVAHNHKATILPLGIYAAAIRHPPAIYPTAWPLHMSHDEATRKPCHADITPIVVALYV